MLLGAGAAAAAICSAGGLVGMTKFAVGTMYGICCIDGKVGVDPGAVCCTGGLLWAWP